MIELFSTEDWVFVIGDHLLWDHVFVMLLGFDCILMM